MKKLLFILLLIFSLTTLVFGKVNLNKATKEELMTLKGIGKKKAESIIKYRQKHYFKNVKEVLKIKGIGKNFLKKNRDNLCVSTDCK